MTLQNDLRPARKFKIRYGRKLLSSIPIKRFLLTEGQVKVNFDVAVRKTFAMGNAILRDSQGQIVGVCVNQTQVDEPLKGEAFAAPTGVDEAIRRGFKDIIVEGDSLQLIDSLRKFPARVDWRIFSRVNDIVRSLSRLDSFSFQFVNRGANEEAHHLARWAISVIMSGGHSNIFDFQQLRQPIYVFTVNPINTSFGNGSGIGPFTVEGENPPLAAGGVWPPKTGWPWVEGGVPPPLAARGGGGSPSIFFSNKERNIPDPFKVEGGTLATGGGGTPPSTNWAARVLSLHYEKNRGPSILFF
ncbi:hypothetical protein CJ030_MR3G019069 [Morella rubra]|uniref:RNase H type-1 domain-containing protein n=1 Tax=Morella rubra TaxID=262757 RepID=A0A6A1W610_9ROSI|nr:hypothetical protein CJ030_MR3G019069 [Morella rubra]